MEKKIRKLISEIHDENQKIDDLITNLDEILDKIEKYVLDGSLNIEDHIYDKSIWNDMGIHFLKKGIPQLAIVVYRRMIKTLKEFEKKNNRTVHKGLAFQNLGASLLAQSRLVEAKLNFQYAYDEDIRTYGIDKAQKCLAKKALNEFDIINTVV